MRELILLDGKALGKEIPLRSLFYGEGVFETFRWKNQPPVLLERHFDRMRDGATVLGIPFPGFQGIREGVENAVSGSKIQDAYVKICLLSRGKAAFYDNPDGYSLLTVIREYQTSKEPIRAAISSFRRNSRSPIVSIKSLNYVENVLARREAEGLGFNDAIFLNERGEITEGSTSNVFWLKDGALYTPSLECGLLSGVIRGVLIELAEDLAIEVRQGRFESDSLFSADAAFLTNSLLGITSISQIDEFKLSVDSERLDRIKIALLEKLGWNRSHFMPSY